MPDSRECVNIRTEDGRMCASISGDIDHHSAREMRLRIDTAFAVSDARELILDMSGVKFMDSSGLGLILGRFTKASAQGASFGVINPSESVKRALDIAGAQRLISIKTDRMTRPLIGLSKIHWESLCLKVLTNMQKWD